VFTPKAQETHRSGCNECFDRGVKAALLPQDQVLADVRFGSKADVLDAQRDVR
jgi:hypothetical protein